MTTQTDTARRQRHLAVLARAGRGLLEDAFALVRPAPRYEVVKPAETGLVMVRGRAGGTGGQFNMGEMTVTRCVVRSEQGAVGVGYVAGRDRRKAELVAVFDALLQDPSHSPQVERDVIAPAERRHKERQNAIRARAATTRVDFFTVVRGE
jgi:alpha-D-ribose 1-methylphosphonate 5-triphosphate synthase subunit PhnG